MSGRRRRISTRAALWRLPLQTVVRSTRRPRGSSHTRRVDVSSRWALKDSVEVSRHRLGIVAFVVALVPIIIIKRILLGLPVLPQFRVTFLERLPLDILFLLFFSFLSPLRTFVSPWTRVSSHDRHCLPLLEASRTERRSVPIRAGVSPTKGQKDQKMCNDNGKSLPG